MTVTRTPSDRRSLAREALRNQSRNAPCDTQLCL